MEAHIQALRINRNPLNLVLGTKRKLGLRIGYMEAALKGFYLNSIETGVHPQKLTQFIQIRKIYRGKKRPDYMDK